MKIGIFTALFHDKPIEEALDIIAANGIHAVELGAGAYPGSRHLDDAGGIETLIKDEGARKKLRKMIESRGLTLDSLSVHGNALHPDKAIGPLRRKRLLGLPRRRPPREEPELGDMRLARRVPGNSRLPVEEGRHPLLEEAEPVFERAQRQVRH